MNAPAASTPIACSLDVGEFQSRLDWIKSLYARSLRRHQLAGGTLRLAFHGDAGADVRELVRKEQECCAFLNFEIEETADEIRLAITAPAGTDAKALLSPFFPEEAQRTKVAPSCGCQ